MNIVSVSKKMKINSNIEFIVEKLNTALRLKDEFAVSILTARLLNMGYRLEVQSEEK